MSTTPCSIVVMGIAGSGKTTVGRALAERFGFVFVDADDLHSDEARSGMAAGVPLTDEQREPWVDALARTLRGLQQRGDSSVLAFSGLRAAHRQRLRDCGVPMRFVFLHAAPTVVATRLAGRSDHFMAPRLLGSQLDALQPATGEPDVVEVNVDCPPAEALDRVVVALESRGKDCTGRVAS